MSTLTDLPLGNCLQRLTFDQAEQSEATEDGFQRIREVTGLTDVMDIVHKLLGFRDYENPLVSRNHKAGVFRALLFLGGGKRSFGGGGTLGSHEKKTVGNLT